MKFTASLDSGRSRRQAAAGADITTRHFADRDRDHGRRIFTSIAAGREMPLARLRRVGLHPGRLLSVTVVDPEGETEVANYGPGDLWYFP